MKHDLAARAKRNRCLASGNPDDTIGSKGGDALGDPRRLGEDVAQLLDVGFVFARRGPGPKATSVLVDHPVRRRVASRHPHDDDSSALSQCDGSSLQVADAGFQAGSRDILEPTPLVVGIAGERHDSVRNTASLGDTDYKIAAGRIGKRRYIRQQFGVIGFFAPVGRLLVVDIKRFRGPAAIRRRTSTSVILSSGMSSNAIQAVPFALTPPFALSRSCGCGDDDSVSG